MGELTAPDLIRALIYNVRPTYDALAQRFKSEQDKKPHKPYDKENLRGKISKHYLRLLIENAPQIKIINKIEDNDAYHSTDNGCQMLIETTAREPDRKDVCTIDTLAEINNRPALIDIRASDWANIRENYFTKRKEYVPILDTIFGKDAYDRMLIVCSDVPPTRDEVGRSIDKRLHRGVHIVQLQIELSKLARIATNIGLQCKLLKQTENSSSVQETTNP